MNLLRELFEAITRGVGIVGRYRRANPCETADYFAMQCKYFRQRGRPALARRAERLEKKWRERCPKRREIQSPPSP